MSPTELACSARTIDDGGLCALLLRAEGTYRPGSEGNPDALALEAAILAARERRHQALVLDLSGVTYSGGDALGALLVRLASGVHGPPLLTVLVASEQNRPALRSLLELMGRKADRWLHASLEEALATVRAAEPGGSCDP